MLSLSFILNLRIKLALFTSFILYVVFLQILEVNGLAYLSFLCSLLSSRLNFKNFVFHLTTFFSTAASAIWVGQRVPAGSSQLVTCFQQGSQIQFSANAVSPLSF